MPVDAHHHVWQVSRGDYGWLTPDLPIHRDYTLDDLRTVCGDVTATVLVQAAPTIGETRFLLDVAQQSGGLVRAVVGWTDLLDRAAPQRIATLAQHSLLKGLRPMLQDIDDTGWILQPAVQPALAAMREHRLRFDALIQPRHLPALLQLCQTHPDLPVVIDHGAKPAIAAAAWQPWADDIARIARETTAFCKLSGLITEAAATWRIDDLRRYVEHLIVSFGTNRVIWGSDWPVVNLAGGYAAWRDATDILLAMLSSSERAAILGSNAVKFYGLPSL